MKRKLTLILAAIMLFAAGCNTYTQDATTAPPQTTAPATTVAGGTTAAATEPADLGPKSFVLADGGDPITLDYGKQADNLSGKALYYTSTALYRPESSTYIPDGAESVEVSGDGLTITFKIREGLVWSDGEPLTAEDYRCAFLHRMDPASAYASANSYYAIEGAKAYNTGEGKAEDVGVSCPDAHTLLFKLAYSYPTMLSSLYLLSPIRADYLDKHGESYGTSPETYIGAGPYNLVSWDYNQQLIFEKNPLYWRAEDVHITHLTWLTITDSNTRMNMYDMGQVDHASVPPASIPSYQGEQIIQYVGGGANALQFNFSNAANPEAGKVLANLNFRKALGYAIERKALSSNISDPSYVATGRMVSNFAVTPSGKPWSEAYTDIELYPATLDEAKAKAYMETALAELGYTSAGDLPTFTFLLFDVPSYRSYAEGFLDVWGRVLGISTIEITVLPIPQAIQTGMSGQFDIYLAGLNVPADPYGLFEGVSPGGTYCWGAWEGGEEFAAMLAATNNITDPQARYDALFKCEQFYAEHGFMIPLWSYGGTTATRPAVGLSGYTVDAFNYPMVQIAFADVIPDSQR